MRYSITINNIKAIEWGLNIQQAYLFAWFYELPSWANKVVIESDIFYFASKNKAIEELPILTDKPDTMYRYYKQLEELGLIVVKKIDAKDYIALTQKAKEWNLFKSEDSEINPSVVGNKSELQSEINPTNNNTISNNDISNKKNNIIQRVIAFKLTLEPFLETYGKDMINDFYLYWKEPNNSGTKFKREFERTWDLERRLSTWAKNDKNFNNNGKFSSNGKQQITGNGKTAYQFTIAGIDSSENGST